MRFLALIVSIGIAVLPKLALAQTDCGMPRPGEDHWPVAAPDSVGLAGATLCPMVKWLDDWKLGNIHAVLVARHGTLVFEHYFPERTSIGADRSARSHSARRLSTTSGRQRRASSPSCSESPSIAG